MNAGPLEGVTVVELTNHASVVGLGLAAGLPGMLLAQLGATVVRLSPPHDPPLDDGVEWATVWNHRKKIVRTDDMGAIREQLVAADVVIAYGDERDVERRGVGYAALAARNPRLVYCRVRPSVNSLGRLADYSILVEAAAGLYSQTFRSTDRPVVANSHSADAGAAFLATVGMLALLLRRATRGHGGWTETSLYDGLLAMIGGIVGRPEVKSSVAEMHWSTGPKYHDLVFECASGEPIQLWIGGKGMYHALCELFGDPCDGDNYTHSETGELTRRAQRWATEFGKLPRDVWIERLRALGVACEPVLDQGEALLEESLEAVGLVEVDHDGQGGWLRHVGRPVQVVPRPADADERTRAVGDRSASPGDPPLAGVRVLDFSAFVAGPFAAQVLADLGADVIRVEHPQGDQMQTSVWNAACQRGKRSVALDLRSDAAKKPLEALLAGADVVLHNLRLGVAERLNIDERSVRRINPDVVYCHVTAAGAAGPRAQRPGADALMQAASGLKASMAGEGNPPASVRWVPVDIACGWIVACGVLAALYAREQTQTGQSVSGALLGAALLLESAVFYRGGDLVAGPVLDSGRNGLGPGYRIYRTADDEWIAVVLPDPEAWSRLRAIPRCHAMPDKYVPLRLPSTEDEARRAERALEAAFASTAADTWVDLLDTLDIPAARLVRTTPDAFRRGVLDDPVNAQLGRLTSCRTPAWGVLEQIGSVLRLGPSQGSSKPPEIPSRGAHTRDIFASLGVDFRDVLPDRFATHD